MKHHTFKLEVGPETLAGDWLAGSGPTQGLFLHGAGKSSQAWLPLRKRLADHGIGSVAVDFSGHGESTSLTPGSLAKRYTEATAVLSSMGGGAPRVVMGVSMSGEIAARLACDRFGKADHLVTIVGAAYDPLAFPVPFGPDFSKVIRRPGSWQESVVFRNIRQFQGSVTVICADADEVVPPGVGEKLLENAVSARSRQLLRVKNATHRMSEMLYLPPPFHDGLASSLALHIFRAVANLPPVGDDLCTALSYPVAGEKR